MSWRIANVENVRPAPTWYTLPEPPRIQIVFIISNPISDAAVVLMSSSSPVVSDFVRCSRRATHPRRDRRSLSYGRVWRERRFVTCCTTAKTAFGKTTFWHFNGLVVSVVRVCVSYTDVVARRVCFVTAALLSNAFVMACPG